MGSVDTVREQLNALIESGKTKAAVDLAKLAHKQMDSAESEGLLACAYVARIRGMIEKGMAGEGQALLDLARTRHPAQSSLFDGLVMELAVHTGRFDHLLAPLADPDLAAEDRQRIENVLKQQARDLQALSECHVLPSDHPLRRAADATWRAFQAVTSGPVDDEVIALPEVSRRSPLAPWKALIRAIAHFYRREDDACRLHLRSIDPESAPAGLASAIEAMLDGTRPGKDRSPAHDLMRGVSGDLTRLRDLLERADRTILEDNFYSDDPRAMKAIRSAANACTGLDTATARRIHRNLWTRAFYAGYDMEALDQAFPTPVLRDSAFWALLARLDTEGVDEDYLNPLVSCACWEEFRSQAVREGLFAEKSPEEAIVYRLMLVRLLDIPPDEFDDELSELMSRTRRYKPLYRGQPKPIRDAASYFGVLSPPSAYFLRPEDLFARVEAADATPQTYRRWFAWAGENRSPKEAEEVAHRWIKAFPKNPEPYLNLMEGAEKRGAFKKALTLLAQAEEVDALNPRVRQARLRLHMGALERHIKQNKPHLAAGDLAAIDAIPAIDGQDRRAVKAAMHWAHCVLDDDRQGAERFEDTVAQLTGDALAASMLCWGMAKHLGVPTKNLPKLTRPTGRKYKGKQAAAAGMAAALADSIGILLPLPPGWEAGLRQDLQRHAKKVAPAHLQALADLCIMHRDYETAYYATGAALLQEGLHLARTLYLRAQTISVDFPWRKLQCLSAAIELARKQRDLALIDEAVEELNANIVVRTLAGPQTTSDIPAEHLRHIIAHEKREKRMPRQAPYSYPREPHHFRRCNCEMCREERLRSPFIQTGSYGSRYDLEEDFEDDEADFDEVGLPNGWDPFGGEIPKDLADELDKLLDRMLKKGKSMAEIELAAMKRMLEYVSRHPERASVPDRGAKEESSGNQGDLFDDVPF